MCTSAGGSILRRRPAAVVMAESDPAAGRGVSPTVALPQGVTSPLGVEPDVVEPRGMTAEEPSALWCNTRYGR
jgi:hypothetical protein